MIIEPHPIAFLPTPDLRELFERVADLSQDERAAYLREACVSAEDQAALAALIDADRRERALFDTPAADWAEQLDIDAFDAGAMIGQSVGPYRIVELLGQGGSAVVFRATRAIGEAEQTVAIKLLRNGLFSAESRRRFRREQAILVQLSHPNIARLIDGGISDAGIPYIAMEQVNGVQLIAYAKAHSLDRRARLRLLGKLCRAVDAAHRALIVHRDLKPTNVLVTSDGDIKVLDFGIAKLVDDDEPATATQHIALTPGYAAPEQYARGPVTTSTDVYALGVLAGELLIGARLGPDASWANAADDARVTTRRLWRGLDSELADILRATLAADPARRYSSAGHLADDIARYLRNEPIAASPPSRWYRARKFAARHRGGVVATVSLMFVTFVALALAIWQAGVARREALNTRAELSRANAMRDFMFDAFGDAEPNVPRAAPATVVDAVERAIATTREDREASPRARVELLTRLGNVLSSQGKIDRAKELLDWTVADAVEKLGADDVLTLEAGRVSARNAIQRSDYADARARIDDLLQRVPAGTSDLRIRLLLDSATLATKQRELARARREGSEAVAMARRSGDTDLLRAALGDYGNVLLTLGEVADSIPVYEDLLVIEQARFGDRHASVAAVRASLARAYRRNGELDRAEANARAALAVDRAVYAADDWRTANHLNALAAVLKERRDYRGALEAELEALRINRSTLGEDHPSTATSLNNVGWYYSLVEDFADAVVPLRESLEHTVRKFGAEHPESADVRASYGYALAKSGKVAAGEAEIDHAIASFAALADADPDSLASALEKRVRIALDRDDGVVALPQIERIADAMRQVSAQDAYWDGRIATLRGNALLDLHRLAEAADALDQGRTELDRSAHPEPALNIENALLRAAAAQASGNRDRAYALAIEARRSLASLPNPPRRLTALASTLPTQ